MTKFFKCGNIWQKGHDCKTKQDKKDQPDQKDKLKNQKETQKKCFNCKSSWQPGHKCKELNSTRVLENSNPYKDLLESIFENDSTYLKHVYKVSDGIKFHISKTQIIHVKTLRKNDGLGVG